MQYLYLDCSHGLSGDMFLAGLVDLGLDLDPFTAKLNNLGLEVELKVIPEQRDGFAGKKLHIAANQEQPLRHLEDILNLARDLKISDTVWGKSRLALTRLAEVEAKVHGIRLDQVHFHEIGAVDTLIDVVAAFWGLEQLGISKVVSSPLPWFCGEIKTEHGVINLPAPATLELLQGKPLVESRYTWEIITPTGALLLDSLVSEYKQQPSGILRKTGLSFGSQKQGKPLRLFLFEDNRQSAEAFIEDIWVLESNIDHLTGEELGSIFTEILEQGALDIIYLPGIMKKNRPAGLVQVLCKDADLNKIQNIFFKQTHSLGIRRQKQERLCLPRFPDSLSNNFSESKNRLSAKSYDLNNERFIRPEHDALCRLAKETGRSVVELRIMLYGFNFE